MGTTTVLKGGAVRVVEHGDSGEQVEAAAAHDDLSFESFVAQAEPRLRRGLVSTYGHERGRDATAEALAYAWEHWDRLRSMENPTGYLFRVAQSKNRRRRPPVFFTIPETIDHEFEPDLPAALQSLSERQRLAVVLVHGFGWTLREVGELTGTNVTTVQNHLNRGLRRLRLALGVLHED
jgi:DNA-directed RNA polymerase specialized sigma24 family protein